MHCRSALQGPTDGRQHAAQSQAVRARRRTLLANAGAHRHPLASPSLFARARRLSEFATIPVRATARSAGYDLSAAHDCIIPACGKAIVKTDLSIACPEGTYGRIAPRSGLAVKNFIDTGAGVIDADYRGPVGVVLFNHAKEDFAVKRGDRIAQLVLERIMTPDVVVCDDLDESERGAGGFGSTGVAALPKPETPIPLESEPAKFEPPATQIQ